ncbi:MAG: ammonium transporter [Fimbriimonadaceae bacterium]|nr:ammonium transporter [Fimbriimonadaceae bacterium]
MGLGRRSWWAAAVLPLLLSPALAQDAAPQVDPGDTAWLLVSTAFVMLMTPGLALFYGGMVRRKNVLGTLMQSFIALAVIAIAWVLVGYSLSFGEGNALIGGLQHIGLLGVGQEPNAYAPTVPALAFMAYQGMFAIITPALISGAVAERMRFGPYVLFILLWSLLVYCPVAHWVWGGGWLGKLGALDFAGGNVVHVSSGVSALVLCLMLGRRRRDEDDIPAPHNLTMTVLGAGLLWFGWFGFNAGSALASNGLAALAFVNTNTSAAAATLGWLLVEWIRHGRPTMLGAASGAVAGLVAVTPAAGFVTPMASLAIGFLGGVICFAAVESKSKLGYDDSLDAFGVHGVGGTWGALATGIFGVAAVNSLGKDGLLAGNPSQLVTQLISIVATWAYAAVVTFVLVKVLGALMPLRLDAEAELEGMDLRLHDELGYRF